jgi:hypothetical protein
MYLFTAPTSYFTRGGLEQAGERHQELSGTFFFNRFNPETERKVFALGIA